MKTRLLALLAALLIPALAFAQAPMDRKAALLRAARACVAQEKLSEAIVQYNDYLIENPEDAAVLSETGAVMLKAGRADEAVVTLAQSLRIKSAQPETIRLLADACIARKDTGAATEIAQLGVIKYPNDLAMRLKLAEVNARAGKKDDAIWQYQAVLKQDPANTTATQALIALGAITTTTLAPTTTLPPTTTTSRPVTTTTKPTTTTTKATTTTVKLTTTTIKPTTTTLKPTTTTTAKPTTTTTLAATTTLMPTTTAKVTTTTQPAVVPVTQGPTSTTLPGATAVRAMPPPATAPVADPKAAAAKAGYEKSVQDRELAGFRSRREAAMKEQAKAAQYEKERAGKEAGDRAARAAAALSPEQKARAEAEAKTIDAEIAAHKARTAKPATPTTTRAK